MKTSALVSALLVLAIGPAFGSESATVPPLRAIGVGADSDNTASHSVACVADLRLQTR